MTVKRTLFEVTLLFLKLGAISFGGPAAHIALMEQEVVRKRGWLSREHFLDLLAATNLVPGPNATEMAIHIGFVHAGWLGLIAGGVAFILPAFLISLTLSYIYGQFGGLPQSAAFFYGINPAVIAIILTTTYRLGKVAIKDKFALMIALFSLGAALLNVDELLIFAIAGCMGILCYAPPKWLKRPLMLALMWIAFQPLSILHSNSSWMDNRLVKLGLFFLKVGSMIFGSGMVLFAFIQKDIINRFGWLTQRELIDAIAVGQMTPGPVLSSATFIGYLVAGWQGAIISTVSIFLPSFIIVSLLSQIIPKLRSSPVAQAFMQGVNAAVVALILSISLSLFRAAIVDLWTLIILLFGLVLLIRTHVDTFWVVLGGAFAGMIRYLSLGIVK
jgi:chromate transporter